jgi:hypothetical protein
MSLIREGIPADPRFCPGPWNKPPPAAAPPASHRPTRDRVILRRTHHQPALPRLTLIRAGKQPVSRSRQPHISRQVEIGHPRTHLARRQRNLLQPIDALPRSPSRHNFRPVFTMLLRSTQCGELPPSSPSSSAKIPWLVPASTVPSFACAIVYTSRPSRPAEICAQLPPWSLVRKDPAVALVVDHPGQYPLRIAIVRHQRLHHPRRKPLVGLRKSDPIIGAGQHPAAVRRQQNMPRMLWIEIDVVHDHVRAGQQLPFMPASRVRYSPSVVPAYTTSR